MNRNEREAIADRILIMRCGEGWYPIDGVPDVPMAIQARDNGVPNKHILWVEDRHGNVLWKRMDEN